MNTALEFIKASSVFTLPLSIELRLESAPLAS